MEHVELISQGECANCDAIVAVEMVYDDETPIETGYICLVCGYRNYEPYDETEE